MPNNELHDQLKQAVAQLKLKPKFEAFKRFKTDKAIFDTLIKGKVFEIEYSGFNKYLNNRHKRNNANKYHELLAVLEPYIKEAHGLIWDERQNKYSEVLYTSGSLNLNDLNGVWILYTSHPLYYDGDSQSRVPKEDFTKCAIVTAKVEILEGRIVNLIFPISKLIGSIYSLPGTKKICIDLDSESRDRKALLIGELGASGESDYTKWPRINLCFANSGFREITFGLCVLKRCPGASYDDKEMEPKLLTIPEMEKIDKSIVDFLKGKNDEYGTQYTLRDYEARVSN